MIRATKTLPATCLTLCFALMLSLTACSEDYQALGGTDERGGDGAKTTVGDVRIGPDEPIMVAVDEIEWRLGPESLEEGAEYAVLEGDPSKNELFTMRLRLPDGFRIMPHTHPNVERATVLSGTLHFGHGDTFDEGAARRLDAGSYLAMPPEMEHFAYAQGETVLQLTSIGPWEINYINPEHDPRKRED